jgi:biotin carboxyl carrier protein
MQAEREAQREAQRSRDLFDRGYVSRARIDETDRAVRVAAAQFDSARASAQANTGGGTETAQVRLRIDEARAAVALAQARLAQTRIVAPADGRIVVRLVDPGQIVQPGRALFTFAAAGATQLVGQADEKFLAYLAVGQPARVVVDAFAQQPFDARLAHIAPGIDAQRGTVEVKFEVEPNEPGKGFEFESKIIGGAVPKEYIPGVEKGLNSVISSGVLAGFPVVDVKVSLVDGAFHEVDSSALAFEIASRAGLREGLQKGGSVLLEPIMKVEVVTPEDYTGSVIGDLNSRRGQIQGQDMRGNAVVINAMVPLANMFCYVNQLRSFSQGRANYTMQFDHYEQVPSAVAAEVQAKYA